MIFWGRVWLDADVDVSFVLWLYARFSLGLCRSFEDAHVRYFLLFVVFVVVIQMISETWSLHQVDSETGP